MKGKNLTLVIILAILIASCGPKQKQYYYSFEGSELIPIKEFSDSAAYMDVFSFFQPYKRDERELDSISKGGFLYIPREIPYFDLYNEKKEKITMLVNFKNKDSLERDVIHQVELTPSIVRKTAIEYKENKRKRKW